MGAPKTKYTLNDLPKYSSWPSRLLGLDVFPKLTKNQAELNREYDRQKWKELLDKTGSLKRGFNLRDVEMKYLGNKMVLTYFKGNFSLLPAIKGQQKNKEIIKNTILKYLGNSPSLVELGSGYGSIIISLAKNKQLKNLKFFGAEISANGRKLTKMISKNERVKLEVIKCDLFGKKILETPIPKNSTIFTSYAASCMPRLSHTFVDSVIKLSPTVVIHYEPCYEHCQKDALYGLMRKRYIEVNDYNRNLLTVLQEAQKKRKLKILEVEPEVFGLNALFPASIIVWTPKRHLDNLQKPSKDAKRK